MVSEGTFSQHTHVSEVSLLFCDAIRIFEMFHSLWLCLCFSVLLATLSFECTSPVRVLLNYFIQGSIFGLTDRLDQSSALFVYCLHPPSRRQGVGLVLFYLDKHGLS